MRVKTVPPLLGEGAHCQSSVALGCFPHGCSVSPRYTQEDARWPGLARKPVVASPGKQCHPCPGSPSRPTPGPLHATPRNATHTQDVPTLAGRLPGGLPSPPPPRHTVSCIPCAPARPPDWLSEPGDTGAAARTDPPPPLPFSSGEEEPAPSSVVRGESHTRAHAPVPQAHPPLLGA